MMPDAKVHHGQIQVDCDTACGFAEAYRLNAWHCVDVFVYFSHHLVTIPPPGWINAAHRNGVPVSASGCMSSS